MGNRLFSIVDKLKEQHSLTLLEYEELIRDRNDEVASYLRNEAVTARKAVYDNTVFIRGLIEISNVCKNDCFYCGIRRSNRECDRYRLNTDEILECCDEGYSLGFRTFVMQGGEDSYFSDDVLSNIIIKIKNKYPECAVTLSLGERSYDSYKKLFDAGADRYLLRHETADATHYKKLHPSEMSFERRMKCLEELREIGYQVGCGFMVGSPYQTYKTISKDLKFIEKFKPDMCGIGPFIPHKATPFYDKSAGTVELTCYLLSIIRLIYPSILLPSTTALGTIEENGREKGILSGANVVMPNLSPVSTREKYELYNNKAAFGAESAQGLKELSKRMKNIGYSIIVDRGDIKK